MRISLQSWQRVALSIAVILALTISGTAQTNEGPSPLGDMNIRQAVVHDFASYEDTFATALAFTPDSQSLICGLANGRVIVLSVPDGIPIAELPPHEGAVTSVSCSPDGIWMASSGEDGYAYVTGPADGDSPLALAHVGILHDIAFSPLGTYLMTAGEERRVRIWNTATWEELAPIVGHSGTIYALAISPAEDLLVTGAGGSDPSIRLWDLATGVQLQNDLYEGTVYDVEYCPRARDRYASIAGTQRMIRMWDVDTGAMRHNVGRFTDAVNDVAYSILGNTLAAVSQDGTFFFTTMPSWTEKRRIEFDEPLVAVAFSNSRQYICLSDSTGHVYLLYLPE
ncbi:hypothetical protein KKG90_02465 [Candidatus Bipolaricaulota bacterium]|nr:hypothetical protein [Candidatus Bipolaricaulota bacterium]